MADPRCTYHIRFPNIHLSSLLCPLRPLTQASLPYPTQKLPKPPRFLAPAAPPSPSHSHLVIRLIHILLSNKPDISHLPYRPYPSLFDDFVGDEDSEEERWLEMDSVSQRA